MPIRSTKWAFPRNRRKARFDIFKNFKKFFRTCLKLSCAVVLIGENEVLLDERGAGR